ncbi:hypothetical protein DYB35_005283 [Aphanomyces astaci]|uniref:RanBP2-type domain-containing protein n=2 Tax=Aphanomyces astaci TaxID=112090 RepID=A0A418DDE8_APHAT|nr:hypothetical protein DYB35_005283 [Aphanomyces astaci]
MQSLDRAESWRCSACSADNMPATTSCAQCNQPQGIVATTTGSAKSQLEPRQNLTEISSVFLELVQAGDVPKLTKLVETVSARPLLNSFGKEGTALAVACRYNHLPMVWYLVHTIGMSLASKVNASDDTALHVAARHGHMDIVAQIAPFVHLGVKNLDGHTAMCVACVEDQVSIVNFLVETYPANYPELLPFLHLAVQSSARQVLATLLPRAKTTLREDKTLLQRAIQLKDQRMCMQLLKEGATSTGLDSNSVQYIHSILYPRAAAPLDQDSKPSSTPHLDTKDVSKVSEMSRPLVPTTACTTDTSTRTISPSLPPLGVATPADKSERGKVKLAIGQHSDWGTVLKQHVPASDVAAAKNFQREFARLQRKQVGRTNALVRFVGTDDADAVMLYEPPGVALSRAGESPQPQPFAEYASQKKSWSDVGFLHDIAEAVAFLHESGRAHGAIHSAHCFVDPLNGGGKLLVAYKGVASSTAFAAPETRQVGGGGFDAYAADVYSLGLVFLSVPGLNVTYAARELVQAMTSVQPAHRPKMAEVLSHPTWWSTKKQLLYIQSIATYAADHSRIARIRSLTSPNWQAKLPPVVLAGTNLHRTYNHTVFALVRYIRNFKEHGRDHSSDMWLALHGAIGGDNRRVVDVTNLEFQEQCLASFVAQTYPTLVVDLWRVIGSLE